jgi:CRISPR system Cascade subunit CasE
MSLYLSRLLLDGRSRQAMSEVAHPYEMHRTLMRAFPATARVGQGARADCGVLFRADTDDRQRVVKVYVQSRFEPDWSFLDHLAGYALDDPARPAYEYRDILPALQGIEEGRVFAFRLRANPTKRVGAPDDAMKGKRVELSREQEQVAWLAAKGHGERSGIPGGFELVPSDQGGGQPLAFRVAARPEGKAIGRKRDGGGSQVITHLSVVFEGLLRVTESEAFLRTLENGIGPAKAYGFGLLSIAPPGPIGQRPSS